MESENTFLKEVTKIKSKSRYVDPSTKILLFAKSAGRCELCNESVIRDSVIGEDINWSEMAHIYAFGEKGPRADKEYLYTNKIDNLILACPSCHEKIDKDKLVKYYTVDFLLKSKKKHEERIKLATSFTDRQKTKVLKMIANIGTENVEVSNFEMFSALMNDNLIPFDVEQEKIDFTSVPALVDELYWNSKKKEIEQKLEKFYSDFDRNGHEHISIFGIGPIPLLMFLGSKLNNKIKTKVFQRHHDNGSWLWKEEKSLASYDHKSIKRNKAFKKVALLLSLSGPIDRGLLPKTIMTSYDVYELKLNSDNPNYNFLRTEKDLYEFKKEFQNCISNIKSSYPGIKEIDLFPAVPAPVAILCGMSLNKNSDPSINIYNTHKKSNFEYSLTINN